MLFDPPPRRVIGTRWQCLGAGRQALLGRPSSVHSPRVPAIKMATSFSAVAGAAARTYARSCQTYCASERPSASLAQLRGTSGPLIAMHELYEHNRDLVHPEPDSSALVAPSRARSDSTYGGNGAHAAFQPERASHGRPATGSTTSTSPLSRRSCSASGRFRRIWLRQGARAGGHRVRQLDQDHDLAHQSSVLTCSVSARWSRPMSARLACPPMVMSTMALAISLVDLLRYMAREFLLILSTASTESALPG